jgi:hypothetical protein
MIRRLPDTATEKVAWGQDTEPPTPIFVREFHVPALVSIHGPTVDAPPAEGKLVTQESTEPTFGVLDT